MPLLNFTLMKQITLKVKEDKFKFFMELIHSLGFVEVEKEPDRDEVLKGIKQGFEEVELIEKGKLKSRSAKDFLNEL